MKTNVVLLPPCTTGPNLYIKAPMNKTTYSNWMFFYISTNCVIT